MSKTKKEKHPPKSPKTPAPQKKDHRIFLVVLMLCAAFVYFNSLKNGYTLDDFSVQKENNIVNQGSKSIPLIWKTSYRYGYMNVKDGLFRPLPLTFFALQWQFFPDKPFFGHLCNLLIYVLTIGFAFVFVRRHLPQLPVWIPFWGLLLFAVHPVHTEVTGSIKSLDELLSFFLGLLSVHFSLKYVKKTEMLSLLLSVVLLFLAFLSKESAVLFLPMLALFLFYDTGHPLNKKITVLALSALSFAAFLLLRRSILGSTVGLDQVSLIDNLLLAAESPMQKFATVCVILGKYLWLMCIPYPLIYTYSYNQIPIVGLSDPTAALSLLIYLAAIAFTAVGVYKRKYWALFASIYLIGLVLYCNLFVTIGTAMAERFMYFSSFGFCLFLPSLFVSSHHTFSDWFANARSRIPAFVLTGICIVFAILTIQRNHDWKDNLTLYRKDLPKSPQSARSHYYLGNEIIKLVGDTLRDTLQRKELVTEAIGYLQTAEKIIPGFSDALTQMGVGYYRIGDYAHAETCYKKALSTNPDDAVSINNLAAIYFVSGRYTEAIAMYQRAVALNPRFADALVNIGSCYGMLNKFPESVQAFQQALAVDPNNAKAYFYLSKSYDFMGEKQKAEEMLKQAKALNPSLQ